MSSGPSPLLKFCISSLCPNILSLYLSNTRSIVTNMKYIVVLILVSMAYCPLHERHQNSRGAVYSFLVVILSSAGAFYALPCLHRISGESSTPAPFWSLSSQCVSVLCIALPPSRIWESSTPAFLWLLSSQVHASFTPCLCLYPTCIAEGMFVSPIWSSFPKFGIISSDRTPTVLQFLSHMTKRIPRKPIAPHERPFNVSSSVE